MKRGGTAVVGHQAVGTHSQLKALASLRLRMVMNAMLVRRSS